MIVEWEMSIGYPSAKREGEVEIDDEEFENKTADQVEEIIAQAIWEDAIQHVDVYPKKKREE